jgi:hypothetical protein
LGSAFFQSTNAAIVHCSLLTCSLVTVRPRKFFLIRTTTVPKETNANHKSAEKDIAEDKQHHPLHEATASLMEHRLQQLHYLLATRPHGLLALLRVNVPCLHKRFFF